MKAAFWHDRWKNDQIDFHNEEVNERLTRHWPTLGIDEGAKVFVPLCGKSLDMRWLRQQGHPVLGVDLSPIAIHAFFSEAGITPSEESEDSSGALPRSSAEGFELFGDMEQRIDDSFAEYIFKFGFPRPNLQARATARRVAGGNPAVAGAATSSGAAASAGSSAEGVAVVKVGRNDPCPCGSGKKYKKCCGA